MKLTDRQHKIYDILISILAVTAAVLIVIDISDELNEWQTNLNQCILAVFMADYVIRLAAAEDKRHFVIHNICDLIAILPFYNIFRGFKLVHVGRTVRLINLPRLFAFLYRPLKKATRFLNTNGFKYVLFVTATIILVGGVLIHFAEGMSISDGIWWSFVTATTVGYGDISPQSLYGRLIAMVLMLVGIGLIGSVTSTLTSYFLKIQRQNVKSSAIQMVQEQLDHFDELSVEDVEDICRILQTIKNKERPKPEKS